MIQKFIKRHHLILEELEQAKKELAWFRDYGYYVANVYRTIDAEACAYADVDHEHEENFKD